MEIEYLVGLYLIGISLDDVRGNVWKVVGGSVLVVLAVLGITLIR